jgi:hypothetical protein
MMGLVITGDLTSVALDEKWKRGFCAHISNGVVCKCSLGEVRGGRLWSHRVAMLVGLTDVVQEEHLGVCIFWFFGA